MNSAILTIDDFSSKITPAITDFLIEKKIPAIFFAAGENVEKHYNEAVYAVQKGFTVGNHSYSHTAFSEISLEEGIEEIEKCEKVLNKLYKDCGKERKHRPFRFPYGDKGGKNKDGIQKYLKENGFHKVNDRFIPYGWWKTHHMDTDIDTFWTFDFEEYLIRSNSGFTKENVFRKMDDRNPEKGAALISENNRHIILMHDQAETDVMVPGYYKLFLSRAIEMGLSFEKPEFILI